MLLPTTYTWSIYVSPKPRPHRVAEKFHFAILRIEATRASRGLSAIAELPVYSLLSVISMIRIHCLMNFKTKTVSAILHYCFISVDNVLFGYDLKLTNADFQTQWLQITVSGRPFVKRFALCCRTVVLSCPVLSVTLVYYGQTVGRIKMKLGMRVGLGPGHIVLDVDPAPPPQTGTASPRRIFSPNLLWPNGWMDQDTAW